MKLREEEAPRVTERGVTAGCQGLCTRAELGFTYSNAISLCASWKKGLPKLTKRYCCTFLLSDVRHGSRCLGHSYQTSKNMREYGDNPTRNFTRSRQQHQHGSTDSQPSIVQRKLSNYLINAHLLILLTTTISSPLFKQLCTILLVRFIMQCNTSDSLSVSSELAYSLAA